MSSAEDEQPAPTERDGLSEHDLEALRTAQAEARAVLDHQIQTYNDVDNKAARTFRLAVLILGLILTAVSFFVRSESHSLDPYINVLTVAGVILLILSFVFAVLTYTISRVETGLGPTAIQRLIDEKYTEKEWLILLLRSEAQWMRRNERGHTINGGLLTISHAALILAVFSLASGITIAGWPP